MLKRHKQPANVPIAVYRVNDVSFFMYADGSAWIGSYKLDQQTVFALSVGLGLPGIRTIINRIERTRQAANAQDSDDQALERR